MGDQSGSYVSFVSDHIVHLNSVNKVARLALLVY